LIGFAEQANVYQLSVRKALSLLQKKYGIIFLDPPYVENTLPVLKMIFSSPLVGENSTVVVEHSHRLLLAGNYENFYLAKFLRHGDACISIYQSIG
jgi:16S rRNA G966 N2-methylase RsmD